MESTTCPSCGGTVPSARFCASCGQPLPAATVSPPPPPAPTSANPTAPAPKQRSTSVPTPTARVVAGWEQGQAVPVPEPREGPQPPPWNATAGETADPSEGSPAASSASAPLNDVEDAVHVGHAGTNKRLGIGAVTAVLLAGAAYLVFGTGTEAHTLNGDLSLSATGTLSPGDSCTGTGGYSDIHEGTQVIVEDENGKTLATSAFGPGNYDGQSCVFTFRFSDVPRAAFYRVHQSSNRGVLQYSYQDLVDADWSVHLTLGDNSGTN